MPFLAIRPFIRIFIHLAVFLTTGPKRTLHIVQSKASSFRWEYSLRSSSSFLHFLHRIPVTSIPPFFFPSITCRRRQFLRKMWPIQLAFRLLISCRIFLCSLTLVILLHFSHDWSNWSSPSFFITTTCIIIQKALKIGRFHPFYRPRSPLGRVAV
jgi:hypothetical protein